MVDTEMDDMDVDDEEVEMDQGRRQRAAEKLAGRFATGKPGPEAKNMGTAQAREILRNLAALFGGNKISTNNAFDLQGIDALSTIVFSDEAKAHALGGESHFQTAGQGLDIGMKIYEKRVDATYNITLSILDICSGVARKGDDVDGADKDQNLTQGEGDADGGAGRAAKARRRQGAANVEATLAENGDLKQRVKEATFDADPFFIRTSRLIDENSPQGLLLHNLPVLCGTDVVFDPNIRPRDCCPKSPKALVQRDLEMRCINVGAFQAGNAPGLKGACGRYEHWKLLHAACAVLAQVDLAALPGVKDCLRAAASAPLSPGIEQLYALLQPRLDLPGLEVARQVDPEKLLRDALAANESARAEAQRNLVVRQVVRQAEDAMDVDMDDPAGAQGDGDRHQQQQQQQDGPWGDGGDDQAEPPMDASAEGYDSPGYGAGGDDEPYTNEDDQRDGHFGAAASDDERADGQAAGAFGNDAAGADGAASDDESALLSLLGVASSSAPGGSVALQRTWWKTHARKAAGAATKPRVRKPKPEYQALDWRASPEPQLEPVSQHTYKTARRDASAKLCMPLEEPARLDALRCYFSAAPAVSDMGCPAVGGGPGILGVLGGRARGHSGTTDGCSSFSCSVQETWRALLISDNQRERLLRRGARGPAAAAARKSLGIAAAAAAAGTPGTPAVHGGGPAASATDGPYDTPGGGAVLDSAGQYDGDGGDDGGFDDAGAGGSYADYDDDYDVDDGAAGGDGAVRLVVHGGQDGRAPTLEELLQPPRRVRRLPVKFDKTAGVADVATLKANIEVSLKELAVATASRRRQSAPLVAPPLSFQSVLDQVSARAAGGPAASQEGPCTSAAGGGIVPASNGGAAAAATKGPAYSLAGVSTHLAFICLLHLANEKGLALGSSEQLDTLMITGLGDLMAAEGR